MPAFFNSGGPLRAQFNLVSDLGGSRLDFGMGSKQVTACIWLFARRMAPIIRKPSRVGIFAPTPVGFATSAHAKCAFSYGFKRESEFCFGSILATRITW